MHQLIKKGLVVIGDTIFKKYLENLYYWFIDFWLLFFIWILFSGLFTII